MVSLNRQQSKKISNLKQNYNKKRFKKEDDADYMPSEASDEDSLEETINNDTKEGSSSNDNYSDIDNIIANERDVTMFIYDISTGILTNVVQMSNLKTYTKNGEPAEQRNFVINNLSQNAVKRRTTGDLSGSRRSKTVVYFLKDEDGAKQNVCKAFFIETLGNKTKNDRFVRDVLNKSKNAGLTPNPNKRGKKEKVKIDRDIIINHIESFQLTNAHYRREHAPKRRYLPSGITIHQMHDNFKTKHSHIQCSHYLYREVVIMLPRIEMFKEAIFTPRIIAFNESFVPVGKKQSGPTAVLWHEAVSGRSKEDQISTFYAFLLSARDKKNIVLWLDNCFSQNENWSLFTFFIYIVNSNEVLLDKLVVKYFEPGHTFMSADSFHHNVEKSFETSWKGL
ncbi:unnamed protein product [Psylliodes chrysocephalus]|uniref:Uncharacterized protein n=1 Tax=Psylliodes chrysocephalus TaxID=3402493 RepID=A0A9P0CYN0_9CUCU|nr:unnamed protein product [Psylliodes chrysocephala]